MSVDFLTQMFYTLSVMIKNTNIYLKTKVRYLIIVYRLLSNRTNNLSFGLLYMTLLNDNSSVIFNIYRVIRVVKRTRKQEV